MLGNNRFLHCRLEFVLSGTGCSWSHYDTGSGSMAVLLLLLEKVCIVVHVHMILSFSFNRRKSARRKRFKYAILNHKHDNGHMLAKSKSACTIHKHCEIHIVCACVNVILEVMFVSFQNKKAFMQLSEML